MQFPPGHFFPSMEERRKREYCLFNENWGHTIANCVLFRHTIQDCVCSSFSSRISQRNPWEWIRLHFQRLACLLPRGAPMMLSYFPKKELHPIPP